MSSLYTCPPPPPLPSLATTAASLASIVKASQVGGTCQDAFVLSLRDGEEFSTLHSYGFLRVPHVGVYGNNYSLTVPLVLLSLPPSVSYMKQLPPDILNSLDVDLEHHYQATLVSVSKELVRRVLQSALRQAELVKSFGTGREVEYRMTGASSFLTTETEEGGTCTHSPDVTPSADEMEDMESIRLEAKKIVRKAIHLAWRRWETLHQQESIDYLIASAKRLRIQESPSPTDVSSSESSVGSSALNPFSCKSKGANQNVPARDGASLFRPISSAASSFSASSSLHLASVVSSSEERQGPPTLQSESFLQPLGKKRPRSDSHDASMMRDLNKFRSRLQRQSHVQVSSVPELTPAEPDRRDATGDLSDEVSGALSQMLERSRLSDVVAGLKNVSIMELEEETKESEGESDEESYVVLDAVTKPPPLLSQEVSSLPSTPTSPLDPEDQRPCCATTDTVSTSFSAALSDKTGSIFGSMSPGFVSPISHPDSHSIPDIDYFFILHSYPPPGVCQKFTCSNENEVNLVFHCWMYQDIPCDPGFSVTDQVEMGVFEPSGVLPVHLDLQDSGISFCYLEKRTVCIHECCFSPENAQLQLCPGVSLHTFFSVARHGMRKVVTYHAIPANPEVELLAHQVLAEGGETLAGLLNGLEKAFPELSSMMQHLLLPLWST